MKKNTQKSSKPKKAQKPQKQKKTKPSVQAQKPVFQLSPCAKTYAIALTDPFRLLSDVCIPDIHDLPSWKLRTLIRGVLTVGTQGVGYIVCSSRCACNDADVAIISNNSFATTVVPLPGTTGMTAVFDTQFPYSFSLVTGGAAGIRVAATGVRVRYIGTELNRGGRLILFRYPTDQTAAGDSPAFLLGRAETISRPVERRFHGISYIPQRSTDYDYISSADPILSSGSNEDLGICIDGAVPGVAFEFEVVRYYEIISGTVTVPNLSATHSDLAGLTAIRNSLEGKNFDAGPGALSMLTNALQQYAPESVSRFVSRANLALEVGSAVLS